MANETVTAAPVPRTQCHWAATGIIYLIFTATGTAIVLPGTLLPSLLVRWSLTDQQAGLLFLFFFIGSSTGALLSRGRLYYSVARGAIISAAGVGLLAVASQVSSFFAMLLFGLGLGLTMTSVSLLQSRRCATTRKTEMARLNLLWAVGASLGPSMLLRGVTRWSFSTVVFTASSLFVVFAMLAASMLNSSETASPKHISKDFLGNFSAIPLLSLALVPLATGVESSVGGWLATYSRREGLMLGQTVSTVTLFWLGLMLGRLVLSGRLGTKLSEKVTLRFAPLLMIVGSVLLIAGHSQSYLLAGAILIGFGVGPVYPLMLGLLLKETNADNVIFLTAGIGASALPLLTGLVSGATGSLATGLAVPLVASVMMALFGHSVNTGQRQSTAISN